LVSNLNYAIALFTKYKLTIMVKILGLSEAEKCTN